VGQAVKHYLFRIQPTEAVSGFGGLFCDWTGSGAGHARHHPDRSVTPESPLSLLLVFLASRFDIGKELPVGRWSRKPDLLARFCNRMLASPSGELITIDVPDMTARWELSADHGFQV
jgi:hypothetical protein